MKAKKLTYLEAAVLVLKENNFPISSKEIFSQILERRLMDHVDTLSYKNVRTIIDRDIKLNPTTTMFIKKDRLYSINKDLANRYIHFSKKHSRILVVKVEELGKHNFHGIRKYIDSYEKILLKNPNPRFEKRLSAEDNPKLKQIVSYIIIEIDGKLLRFRRQSTKINRVGDFVDGHYSLGFGGHVQEDDKNLFSIYPTGYLESVCRELFEEIRIEIEPDDERLKFLGVLNDNSSPLGEKHIAFIHLLKITSKNNTSENNLFDAGEQGIQEPKLVSFSEISEEFQLYEYWSKLCLLEFYKDKLNFKCHIQPQTHFLLSENKKFILIVGGIGSGKSVASRLFAKEFGYINVPCSKILKNILKIPNNKNISRKNLQDLGFKFVNSKNGHANFAKALFDYINLSKGDRFVLDGLRYPETLFELEKLIKSKVSIIYVDTMVEIRYKNFISRDGNKNLTLDEFFEIIDHPVEGSIQKFLPYAQIVVFNQASLNSFEDELMKYLESELGPIDKFLELSWDINALRRHDQLIRGIDISFSELLVPHLIKVLQSKSNYENFNVLDVGCGTGVFTKIIGKLVRQVIGIDISNKSIEIATDYCRGIKNVFFEFSSIENFKSEIKFDFIFAHMVLHTISPTTIDIAIKQLYSLLNDDGLFVFSIPHPVFYPPSKEETFYVTNKEYNYATPGFYRHTFKISNDSNPLPSKTPYFHRPMESYTEILENGGFFIRRMYEPTPSDDVKKKYPKDKKFEQPYFMIFLCEKYRNKNKG